MVEDIRPGSVAPPRSHELTRVGNRSSSGLDDGTDGSELWKSDGTAAGTVLVNDLPRELRAPQHLTDVNGMLYFTATSAGLGSELYKSDGTGRGTVLVKDIVPGSSGSNPGQPDQLPGQLFFTATDGQRTTLWKSDGTAAGTRACRTIRLGPRRLPAS